MWGFKKRWKRGKISKWVWNLNQHLINTWGRREDQRKKNCLKSRGKGFCLRALGHLSHLFGALQGKVRNKEKERDRGIKGKKMGTSRKCRRQKKLNLVWNYYEQKIIKLNKRRWSWNLKKKKMEADSWVMRGRATQTSPLWFMAWSVWHIISTQTHIQSDYLDTASTLTNKHSSLRHNHPWFSETHETHLGNTESPVIETQRHTHTHLGVRLLCPWRSVTLYAS